MIHCESERPLGDFSLLPALSASSVGWSLGPRSHGGRICQFILAAAADHRLIKVTRAEQNRSDSGLYDHPRIVVTQAKQNAETDLVKQSMRAKARL